MKKVTVGRYLLEHEAEMARMHLEAAGIPTFLKDPTSIRMLWAAGLLTGWIQLEVPEDRADEARAILRELPEATDSLAAPLLRCQACGSDDLEPLEVSSPLGGGGSYEVRCCNCGSVVQESEI
jgi:hypothetical protein